MNIKILNNQGNMEFESSEIKQEFGFLVFKESEDKEIFVSPSMIQVMEITGRPKKKEEKPKSTKKSSGGQPTY